MKVRLTVEVLEGEVRRVGGHCQDTHGVGVAEATLPALHGDDLDTRLEDVDVERGAEAVADAVVDIRLPLVALDATGLGVEDGVAATVQVKLARGLLAASDGDDGDAGAVLGDEARGLAARGEDDDGTSVVLRGSGDGGNGNSLGGGHRARLQ